MENNNETPQPISIELTENIAEGTYSNLAVITQRQKSNLALL
jgi:hypothetical protein